MHDPITQAEYRTFQQAYDFFNAELFAGTLPQVLVAKIQPFYHQKEPARLPGSLTFLPNPRLPARPNP